MSYLGSVNFFRGYWAWVNVQTVVRPSRLLPNSQKDEYYDASCARYYLGMQQASQVNTFRQAYNINALYATNSRWGEAEDEKLFLGDSVNPTGRVALQYPLVQPTLTRLRGVASNISIFPIATAATSYAKTRKEAKKKQAMLYSQAAQAGPMMAAAYAPMGISPDEGETEDMFENSYQDDLELAASNLMEMISEENGLDDQKREVAEQMALSGLTAFHASVQGSRLVWELCDSNEVGWDPSCIRADFADGEYVFTCPLYSVSTIAERWQPKKKSIEDLDRWANITTSNYTAAGWPQMRPRVFTVYWKDIDTVERGYVLKDGEPHLCTINRPDKERRGDEPMYTDADLIPPPENKYTAAWTDAEWASRKTTRYVEVIRYCSLIPWEYLPGAYTDNKVFKDRMSARSIIEGRGTVTGDLILASGICDLQEVDPDDSYQKGFPLKMSAWTLIAGNVVAPLTAAISPQRMMNQITSDLMWRLRKAGNKSVALDSDAIAGSSMSHSEIINALKEGDPIDMKGAVTNGLQQAVQNIDTSPGNSFYQMFAMLPQIKAIAESGTGVYESNFGAPQGQDQLVGTLQLQLQQAGVMQVPFNAAVAHLYEQVHQYDVQAGKQHYARYPWILSQMVGDSGMEAIMVSREMMIEQFRIRVELTEDAAQQRIMADNMIIPQLLAEGSLDLLTANKLRGKAFPHQCYRAAEKFCMMKAKADAQAAKQQQIQMQQQQMALEDAQIRDEEAEVAKQDTDAKLKMAAINQKMAQPEIQAAADWMKPPDPLKPTGA
mgnify:CR=1 FL=1